MSDFSVGDIALTRVPYFDVPLDAQVIGFTAEEVTVVPWGSPTWATADGRVIVGQAVWVATSGERTIVVDPCGASDAFLRTGPEAATHETAVVAAMESAGFPIECVDTVVLSHLDGIGMAGSVNEEGRWSPLFPNARIVISEPELTHVNAHPEIAGSSALLGFVDQGFVDGVEPPWEIAPGVSMELTAGHTPGHSVVRVEDGAVFIGHLAINPIQVCGGIMSGQHPEPVTAFDALVRELAWAAERDALVIGPLWPEPGAGRVAGPPWSLSPALPAGL
jgi:glyoxylase-like metal-dependent hydrolase (beta-lactamase superfamily II)